MNLFELTAAIISRECRVTLPVAQQATEVLVREGVLQSTDPNDLLNFNVAVDRWREYAIRAVEEQHEWIQAHGGDIGGYIARYGSVSDPDHYGDGGENIYAADIQRLRVVEAALLRLTPPEQVEYRRVRDY